MPFPCWFCGKLLPGAVPPEASWVPGGLAMADPREELVFPSQAGAGDAPLLGTWRPLSLPRVALAKAGARNTSSLVLEIEAG